MLCGCVVIPGKRISFKDLKIGMTRDEVVNIVGDPHHVAAKGPVEHLYYYEKSTYIGIFGVGQDPDGRGRFQVRLVDGKVESFGESGEFIEEPEEPEE